jgi:hypothetical protein
VLGDVGLFLAAHELAEQGWLQRPLVTEPDGRSWWWSPRAELALELNALARRQRN